MKTLTYVSDSGMIIQFNQSFPFFVTHADLNSVDASFDEMQPLGMDGGYTQGGTYLKKAIPIEGVIIGNSMEEIEQSRNLLAMAMSIYYEGTLIAQLHNGKKKKIRCKPCRAPSYPATFGLSQPFTCEFTCDNPYWLDEQETIVPIGQIVPMLRFPFSTPVTFGRAVAIVTIVNDTPVRIPLRIEIVSQTTMIEICNQTTGELFSVAAMIAENNKMIIDGNTCDITILNMTTGEVTDASNKLKAGSDFITLRPGKNVIELNKGIAGSTPLSYVIYNQHSLAV